MDDNIVLEPQVKNDSAPNEGSTETERNTGGTDRVFEITSDLNISPIKDSEENAQSAPIYKPLPPTPPSHSINLLEKQPTPPIAQTINTTPPTPTVSQPIKTAPTPTFTAPMVTAAPVINTPAPQPITPQFATAQKPPVPGAPPRFSPANPPAKTISSANVVNNDRRNLVNPPSTVSNDPNIKNIRTYEGDVADAISHKNISKAGIAISEGKKNTGSEIMSNVAPSTPSHALRNILFTLLSLVLLAGGVYAAYYLYVSSPLADVTSTPQTTAVTKVASLVPFDAQATINIDNLTSTAIESHIEAEIAKPQSNNTIKDIALVQTGGATVSRVQASRLATILGLNAPDIFTRSLADDWMLGVYADNNGQKNVFVVSTNNFFQNAFAGMLQWESTMPNDLKHYLLYASAASSSTATLRGQFTDRIIKNKDVREFVTADGQTLFLYSFVGSDRLILTGSEATLSEIFNRLEKQSYVR